MTKKRYFLLFAAFSQCTAAQELQYETYEDCILDRMEGISSDIAALAIKDACANKFADEKDSSPISFEERALESTQELTQTIPSETVISEMEESAPANTEDSEEVVELPRFRDQDYTWKTRNFNYEKPISFSMIITSLNAYYADPNNIEETAYLNEKLNAQLESQIAAEVETWASDNKLDYFNAKISHLYDDEFIDDLNNAAYYYKNTGKKKWDYFLSDKTKAEMSFLPTNYLLVIHIDHMNFNEWLQSASDTEIEKITASQGEKVGVEIASNIGGIVGGYFGGLAGELLGKAATNTFVDATPRNLVSAFVVGKDGRVVWATRRSYIISQQKLNASDPDPVGIDLILNASKPFK